MDAAVVKETGKRGRWCARHSALLQELDTHVGTTGVHALHELGHPIMEKRLSEIAIALS
jgi:hypothetical protein